MMSIESSGMPTIIAGKSKTGYKEMYMLIRLLFGRFADRSNLPEDPLARFTPDELADLPPWHPPRQDCNRQD